MFQTGATADRTRWTTTLLPLALFLCFAVAVGLGLYALSSLRTIMVSERGSELAQNAAAVADMLDRVLFERFGDIQLFANDGILREGTPADKTATDGNPFTVAAHATNGVASLEIVEP